MDTSRQQGGFARALSLTPERRREIASQAAKSRWEARDSGSDVPEPPPITDQQILELIESICGDDWCEQMSMDLAREDQEMPKDLKVAVEKLLTIYRIAHSAVQSHSCFPVHGSWRREAFEMHDAMESAI